MSCFLVPVTEAIVVKAFEKSAKSKKTDISASKLSFTRKLHWLSNMLWGGSALLAFEHIWHGEVIPVFPFLTAAANQRDAMAMVHEMSTTGICMALAITAVWVAMVAASVSIEKRAAKAEN